MSSTMPRRAISAIAGTIAIIASALVIGSGMSQAAVDGSLAVTPTSGTDQSQIFITTSGPCSNPNATNVSAKVQGSGFPTNGQNVVSNSPISAYPVAPSGGYTIPLAQNMRDFANQQNPPATLSGRYDITLICRTNTSLTSLGEFLGNLTFTSNTAYTAGASTASTSASASASASVTASSTASASATATPSVSASASVTPSASMTASATPSATASASRSATPSPSATASPAATGSASLRPMPTLLSSARPSPTGLAAPAPGTLTVVDAAGRPVPDGATLQPGAQLTITVTGYRPGERVVVTLFSTPRPMGAVAANGQGLVSYAFVVPRDLASGPHRLRLAGTDQTVEVAFVLAARAAAAPVTASAPRGESLPRTGAHLLSLATLAVGMTAVGSRLLLPPRYVGAHRRR